MSRILVGFVIAGQIVLSSGMATAGSDPQGSRTNAARTTVWGAPQAIGPSVGDPEKDTIAFRQVVVIAERQPAFGSRGASELQGPEPMAIIAAAKACQ